MALVRKQTHVALPLFDRLALALLFFLLLTDVLGGAVRYYSVQFGLPWVPYLPHLLMAAALLPLVLVYLVGKGVSSTFLILSALFGVSIAYGLYNLGNASQVEFGLWILVAFLYGVVVLPSFMRGWHKLVPYAAVLWALALVGVLLNFVYSWPWIGLNYQVGATTVSASRMWSMGGLNIARLPGFSRASFDAALQILFLALLLRVTTRKRWWVPVWILSGLAIALTTDKTAIGIFLIFTVLWIFRRDRIPRFWLKIPFCLACLDILLPFSMLFMKIDLVGLFKSPLWVGLAATFVGRMQNGWPVWLHSIVNHGSPILGRGLGGIGQAQYYFEPALYSPGDNVALYFYGVFGVLGLILLLVYGWKGARVQTHIPAARYLFFCACVVLLDGVTGNVVGESFAALAFGASLRYFLERPALSTLRTCEHGGRRVSSISGGKSQEAYS